MATVQLTRMQSILSKAAREQRVLEPSEARELLGLRAEVHQRASIYEARSADAMVASAATDNRAVGRDTEAFKVLVEAGVVQRRMLGLGWTTDEATARPSARTLSALMRSAVEDGRVTGAEVDTIAAAAEHHLGETLNPDMRWQTKEWLDGFYAANREVLEPEAKAALEKLLKLGPDGEPLRKEEESYDLRFDGPRHLGMGGGD